MEPERADNTAASAAARVAGVRAHTAGSTRANRRKMLRGVLCVAISGILWGFSGTCGQLLSQNCGVPVTWVVVQRLVWSAVFFLIAGLLFKRPQIRRLLSSRRSAVQTAVYAVFGIIGCQWFYLEVIAWTNAGTGTLMEQLGLIVVLVFTCIRQHRGPRALEIIGLVLALLGVFLVSTHGNPSVLVFAPEGFAWGMAAAIGMACYILLPVPLLAEHDSFTITSVAMVVAAVAAVLMFRPWNVHVTLTTEVILGTVGMVVAGTILAYLFFMEGIKYTGPVIAGLLDTIELVAAFVISHFWLGTPVTVWDIAGGICIMGMMALMTWKSPGD